MIKRMLMLVCLLLSICSLNSNAQNKREIKKALGGAKVTEIYEQVWYKKPTYIFLAEDSIPINVDSIQSKPRIIKKILYFKMLNSRPIDVFCCWLKGGGFKYVMLNSNRKYEKITDFNAIWRESEMKEFMESLKTNTTN